MRPLQRIHGRVAAPATFRRNMAKTFLQIVVMWMVFLVLLPAAVLRVEELVGLDRLRFRSPGSEIAGALIFVVAAALALASAVVMVRAGRGTPLPADAPRELVVEGPYAYVRNPMAIGSLAQGFGVGIFLGSPLVIAYALAGTVGWQLFVRPWEELDLERRFGEPYARYRSAVRCWIPRRTPFEDRR